MQQVELLVNLGKDWPTVGGERTKGSIVDVDEKVAERLLAENKAVRTDAKDQTLKTVKEPDLKTDSGKTKSGKTGSTPSGSTNSSSESNPTVPTVPTVEDSKDFNKLTTGKCGDQKSK